MALRRIPISRPWIPLRLASLLAMAAVAFRGAADGTVAVPFVVREDPRGAFVGTASGTNHALFRAVLSRFAVVGCVPVFAIRKDSGLELRRTPPSGLEAEADPDFHAWPAADESDSAKACGRWDVLAVRADGGRQRFPVDLGAHRGRIVGRFDPDTDFRFARVTGGTFARSEITLEVVHIQDRFEVRASLTDGRLTGRWRNVDGSEEGAWSAERRTSGIAVPADADLVDLLGWTAPDGRRTWRPRDRPPAEDWTPDHEPLCRVVRIR